MNTVLGCMEILYQELGLKVDRQVLAASFGKHWQVADVIRYLMGYGYVQIYELPAVGDIVFVGKHPGIVRNAGLVENIHLGRRTYMPLGRIKNQIDVVLRKCQQH